MKYLEIYFVNILKIFFNILIIFVIGLCYLLLIRLLAIKRPVCYRVTGIQRHTNINIQYLCATDWFYHSNYKIELTTFVSNSKKFPQAKLIRVHICL